MVDDRVGLDCGSNSAAAAAAGRPAGRPATVAGRPAGGPAGRPAAAADRNIAEDEGEGVAQMSVADSLNSR